MARALKINTFPADPNTEIIINGSSIEVENGLGFKDNLQGGEISCIIRNSVWGEDYTEIITSNTVTAIEHELRTKFNINAPEGSQVTVDKDGVLTNVGSSGIKLLGYNKELKFTVTKEGCRTKEILYAYVGKKQIEEVSLSASNSVPTLTVRCEDPSAKIEIDSVETNTVSEGESHYVKVSKDGYYTYTKLVALEDKDLDIVVNLREERIKDFQILYPLIWNGETIQTLKSGDQGAIIRIFFKLTPKDFKLREYDPVSDSWRLKHDLQISTNVDDPSSVIDDFSLRTWDSITVPTGWSSYPSHIPGHPIDSNSYFYFHLELKPQSSGQISLSVNIKDGYTTILSNSLEFQVLPTSYPGNTGLDIPTEIFMERNYDTSKHNHELVYGITLETRREYSPSYIILVNDEDTDLAEIDTDGVTIIPKATGTIKVMEFGLFDGRNRYQFKYPSSHGTHTVEISPALPSFQSLEIFLPSFETINNSGVEEIVGRETRCFASFPVPDPAPSSYRPSDTQSKYGIGYKLTPSNYPLALKDLEVRRDIALRVDVISGQEYVDSTEVKPTFGRPWPNISFVPMASGDAPGKVKIKVYIKDLETGEEVGSNVLDLDVMPYQPFPREDNYFTYLETWSVTTLRLLDDSPIILHEGQPYDCRQRMSLKAEWVSGYPKHTGISRYMTVGTSDQTAFIIDTDRTSIIAVKSSTKELRAGIGTKGVSIMGGYGGSYKGWTGNSASIPVVVLDAAEELCFDENFRNSFKFSIDEIRIDRSDTRSYPYTYFHDTFPDGTKLPKHHDNLFKYDGSDKTGCNIGSYINDHYPGKHCISDFLEWHDPDGVFDWERLKFNFVDANGNITGNVCRNWAEGTIYAVATYGVIDDYKVTARIKFTMYTSNPNYIPIRAFGTTSYYGTESGLDADFTKWYPVTKVFNVLPSDATINTWKNDGVINLGASGNMVGLVGLGDVAYVEEVDKSKKSLGERVRIRFAGVGEIDAGYVFHNYWGGGGGDYNLRINHINSDNTKIYQPTNVELIPLKSSIKRGEYTAIKTKFTPEGIDFAISKISYASKSFQGWFFKYDDGDWITAKKIMEAGYINVICASRKGVILQGGPNAPAGEHTIGVRLGYIYTTSFTLSSGTYSIPSGSPSISVKRNSNTLALVHDQDIALVGATPAFWNSGEWRLASVEMKSDGKAHLVTYTAGTVDIYVVTTDGRLVKGTYTTPDSVQEYVDDINSQIETSGSSVVTNPINTLEDPGVDEDTEESVLATDTGDIEVFSFEYPGDIVFESVNSNPVEMKIIKNSPNYRFNAISVVSSNPLVASAVISIDASSNYKIKITPKGKGSAVLRMIHGGSSPVSLNVTVEEGIVPGTYSPNLDYDGTYGVSLKTFEYTTIKIKVASQGVYDAMTFSAPDKIRVTKEGYNSSTKLATLKIEQRGRRSGHVYVNYDTESLSISVACRFWLEFEDLDEFKLGRGASRSILMYPIDDTVKMSEVWIRASKGYVEIGQITAIRDNNGRRAFSVPITCIEVGPADNPKIETLEAGLNSEGDVQVNLSCVGEDIPPTGISFNKSSTKVTLFNNNQ